jgi:AcrR family transcriptional regulator
MPEANNSADPIQAIQAQLVAARRTQILDAATRVFASKGFNRATIHDVARDAGVADGTIYNYFASKTDLLFGLLDRLNDTERRPASLAQATEASFGDSIGDYFCAYLRQRRPISRCAPGAASEPCAACALPRRGDRANDGVG